MAHESKFSAKYEKEYEESVQHIEDAEKQWIYCTWAEAREKNKHR